MRHLAIAAIVLMAAPNLRGHPSFAYDHGPLCAAGPVENAQATAVTVCNPLSQPAVSFQLTSVWLTG